MQEKPKSLWRQFLDTPVASGSLKGLLKKPIKDLRTPEESRPYRISGYRVWKYFFPTIICVGFVAFAYYVLNGVANSINTSNITSGIAAQSGLNTTMQVVNNTGINITSFFWVVVFFPMAWILWNILRKIVI